MKIIKKITNKCLNFLSAIGDIINQTPERNVKKSPHIDQPWQKKKSGINFKENEKAGKFSVRRKGNVNASNTTFNHPRRENDQFSKN